MLICFTDLFNNVVTFRIVDATIDLPTFDMGHSGDIYFEFKTTIENAVILHSNGPTDYIKISIIGMWSVCHMLLTYFQIVLINVRLFFRG